MWIVFNKKKCTAQEPYPYCFLLLEWLPLFILELYIGHNSTRIQDLTLGGGGRGVCQGGGGRGAKKSGKLSVLGIKNHRSAAAGCAPPSGSASAYIPNVCLLLCSIHCTWILCWQYINDYSSYRGWMTWVVCSQWGESHCKSQEP